LIRVYYFLHKTLKNTNTATKLQHSSTAAHREHSDLDHVRLFLHLTTPAILDQLAAPSLYIRKHISQSISNYFQQVFISGAKWWIFDVNRRSITINVSYA